MSVTAVRSCWASAFAVDPLARLDACGLPPEALELGVLLQPEIRPVAGGMARVRARGACGASRRGHGGGGARASRRPAVRLGRGRIRHASGSPWPSRRRTAAGSAARRGQPPAGPAGLSGRSDQGGDAAGGLIGTATVAAVADLAGRAWQRWAMT